MSSEGCVKARALQAPGTPLPALVAVADVDGVVATDHPHPLERQRVWLPGVVGQAEVPQLLDDPRAGVFRARLRPWMGVRLDQQDITAPRGERGGDCGAGRSGADHQDLARERGQAHRYT